MEQWAFGFISLVKNWSIMLYADDTKRADAVDRSTGRGDFPIQNLPFGIFSTENEVVSAGTRIGDVVIDLAALHQLGYFRDLEFGLPDDVFAKHFECIHRTGKTSHSCAARSAGSIVRSSGIDPQRQRSGQKRSRTARC